RRLLDYLNGANKSQGATSLANFSSKSRGMEREVIICGASCRFPAGANDPQTFMDMMRGCVPFLQPIPASWKVSLGVQVAGFLDDNAAETFDQAFFHIGAKEAAQMDPHQRILLEICYEALNDACLLEVKETCSIGVFVGLCNNEWVANRQDDGVTAYTSVCTAQSAAANRVSYILGLTGPSMVIDTACSSSLAAIHIAIQSLLAGDCDAAIVAAADLLISPYSLMVSCTCTFLYFVCSSVFVFCNII
ncbi:polyketide synthase, partial [archaeon]